MFFSFRAAAISAPVFSRFIRITCAQHSTTAVSYTHLITKLMDAGLYPYTKHYLGSFDNHFSTIGLIGMNEVGLNAKWLRKDLTLSLIHI